LPPFISETADTLASLRKCKERGALFFWVNALVWHYSMSNTGAHTFSPESGVAITKLYRPVIAVLMMAFKIGYRKGTLKVERKDIFSF